MPAAPGQPDRYGQALEELEELLEELEDADIDVDHLAERVARGVELVRFCRDRLAVVTTDVDQVVAELRADDFGIAETARTADHKNTDPADDSDEPVLGEDDPSDG